MHNFYHDHEVSYLTILLHLGGASTLQRGIVKTMTRGVNLDKSDFTGINAGTLSLCMRLTSTESLLQFQHLSFQP